MKIDDRQTILKAVAIGIVGLFLLDRIVITPATEAWKEQTDRISALREKVDRGRQLIARKNSIQTHWSDMQNRNLPDDLSTAEDEAFKAIGRWAQNSRITLTSLTPQWQEHDGGYNTFDCRINATGDQPSLARMLYEVEIDPLPVSVDECEITTTDAHGQHLTMSAHVSFVHINKDAGTTSSSTNRGRARQ